MGTGSLQAASTAKHCPVPRHNHQKTFLIWINEEDHTRVISMEKGGNMKRVFERFCRGLKEVSVQQLLLCLPHEQAERGKQGSCGAGPLHTARTGCFMARAERLLVPLIQVERLIQERGWEFMWNERLGYILTCPSNLGTGLRAGVHIKLPLLSKVLPWPVLWGARLGLWGAQPRRCRTAWDPALDHAQVPLGGIGSSPACIPGWRGPGPRCQPGSAQGRTVDGAGDPPTGSCEQQGCCPREHLAAEP